MAISKVIYGGKTLMDLTADTITADKLLTGYTAHGKDGEVISGACTFDADTSDADATAAEILATKSGYVNGVKITGTMPNNGAVSKSIGGAGQDAVLTDLDSTYTIPSGYHDGSGTITYSQAVKDVLIAANVREGVEVLGVTGTMTGTEDVNAQAVTHASVLWDPDAADPQASQDVIITPDGTQGYNYLSSVTITPVPYTVTANAAGGQTVTIGSAS